ncbi:MAG: hypothetical protein ACK5P6_03895 [Pseudobdellovibrionaceae bacterium]
MKYVLSLASLLSLLVIGSCSPPTRYQKVHWTEEMSSQPPALPNQGIASLTQVAAGEEKIQISEQQILGATVENSYVKTIQVAGKKTYISAAFVEKVDSELKADIKSMKQNLDQVILELKKKDSQFLSMKFDEPAKVIVTAEPWGSQALYKVSYLNSQGLRFSTYLNKNFKIIQQNTEGSSFQEAMALVYPESPKKTDLRNVLLRGLSGEGSLVTQNLTVVTESKLRATSENGLFNFAPPGEKFDQVQVFYYINRALSFFQEKLGIRIPFQIRATVHVGYPEKTNTAYYYNGQIRLGSGDDVIFGKIPLDPTIVMHETGHALVEAVARLPYQGEGGSINEAYADFFTAVQLNSPLMGDTAYKKGPFKRTLLNSKKLSERTGGLYGDSAIVSGTLWAIKEKLGDEKAIGFAIEVLKSLHPQSDFEFLKKTFRDEAEKSFKDKDLLDVQAILEERGWS